MTLAYSYIRFSSEKQKHGGSLDRQKDAAFLYAQAHNLVLDNSTYRDLGVSAFKSKNVEGALGAFIEAVESKHVPRGSYLLVEHLDRLSRDTINIAMALLLRVINNGIVVVTLLKGKERVLSEATIKANQLLMMEVVIEMLKANEESETKSKRAHEAIKRRVDRGEISSTRLPTWMKFSPDRKQALLIPERAKIVKRIFDETIDGIGARQITRDLNAKKVPVLSYATEWRQSAISQLLKNPATYGEFKGEIRFPAVVTKARYLKAQQVVRDRTLYKGGFSRSNPHNTFVGLAKCGHCQRPMRFLKRDEGGQYLKCVGSSDNGMCNSRLFPFTACETALVVHLTVMETNFGLTRTIFAEKHERAQTLEGEISLVKAKKARIVQFVEDGNGDVVELSERIKKLQAELVRLENEYKDLGVNTEDHADSIDLFSDYSALVNQRTDYKGKSAVDLTELRRKLKMSFVRVLKRVEFLNADENKWQPTLKLAYVNDRVASVDVTPFLPERTQAQLANGRYHRSDLGKAKPVGHQFKTRVARRKK